MSLKNSDGELYYKIALLHKDSGNYLGEQINDIIEESWLEKDYIDIWASLRRKNELFCEVTIRNFDRTHIKKLKQLIDSIEDGIVIAIGYSIKSSTITEINHYLKSMGKKHIPVYIYEIPKDIVDLIHVTNHNNKVVAYRKIKEVEEKSCLITLKRILPE